MFLIYDYVGIIHFLRFLKNTALLLLLCIIRLEIVQIKY